MKEYKGMIGNLYSFLMKTTENEIVVRTTHVRGGWHDNEFDAHAAGFNIADVERECFPVAEAATRAEFADRLAYYAA